MKSNIRLATNDDITRIWEIRNNPLIRNQSIDKREIDLESHKLWFEETYINNEKNKCFVAEIEKDIVGYCRFDDNEDHIRVSIAIHPDHQGKGLGNELLNTSLKFLHTPKKIKAEVKIDNIPSLKLFEKNNFFIKNQDRENFYLENN